MIYAVMFGYKGFEYDWPQLETDSLTEAFSFIKKYPTKYSARFPGHVYVLNTNSGEIVDGTWYEWEK